MVKEYRVDDRGEKGRAVEKVRVKDERSDLEDEREKGRKEHTRAVVNAAPAAAGTSHQTGQ